MKLRKKQGVPGMGRFGTIFLMVILLLPFGVAAHAQDADEQQQRRQIDDWRTNAQGLINVSTDGTNWKLARPPAPGAVATYDVTTALWQIKLADGSPAFIDTDAMLRSHSLSTVCVTQNPSGDASLQSRAFSGCQ